ncbi:MAG: peroxidase family protein, partial [Phormidesmis sp.]
MVEFRTIDGSNNNPEGLGKSKTQLTRLLNSAYEDGFDLPRGITSAYPEGDPRQIFLGPSRLPNPREISNAVSAQDRSVTNQLDASDWIWQWGQFLDHDLDLNVGGSEAFFIPVDPNDPISGRLPPNSDFAFAEIPMLDGSVDAVVIPFLGDTAEGGLV